MFVRRKKNKSKVISIQIIDKSSGNYKMIKTIRSSTNPVEIEDLVQKGKEWIKENQGILELDFNNERQTARQFLDSIEQINISGTELLLGKLQETQKEEIQKISYEHTLKVLNNEISVVFYDVTTIYFQADNEDEIRKRGFSEEGRHQNPQIVLGLLVSTDGYPLGYEILSLKLSHGESKVIKKDDTLKLIISYSDKRAKKDKHNRERGLLKLEKRIKSGKLTKSSINNRGYNKYLILDGEINISIDNKKFEQDAKWDV